MSAPVPAASGSPDDSSTSLTVKSTDELATLDEGRFRRHLAAALGAGFGWRVLLALLCHEDTPSGDASGYHRLALNLVEHGTYSMDVAAPFSPNVARAPLTAFSLALPLKIGGDSPVLNHFFLIVVSLLGVAVLALGVRKRVPTLALPALWALALVPFGALYPSRLLCETFASAALSIAVGAALWLPPRRAALATGAAIAAAILTRDVYLPLLVALPLAVAWFVPVRASTDGADAPDEPLFSFSSARKHALRCSVVSMLVAALCVAPWTARNFAIGQKTLVTKGLMGINLWIGTWETNGKWMHGNHDFPPEAFVDASPAERATATELLKAPAAGDRAFRDLAVARLKARPGHVVSVWLRRFPYLWVGSRTELFEFRPGFLQRGRPIWTLTKLAGWGLNLGVLGLGLAGAILALRRRHVLRLLVVPIAFTGAVYFPFHNTENRYSEPVYALVLVLAVFAARAAQEWVERRRIQAKNAAPFAPNSEDPQVLQTNRRRSATVPAPGT
jgi:hypothetical protein